MDRFDEMRTKGVNTNDATATSFDILQGKTAYAQGRKITGSLVPSGGGGSEYNVFAQSSEPIEKHGIWIKQGGGSSNVYFGAYFTQKGNFISKDNFSYLETTDAMLGQAVIGDYLYSFGTNSNTSYKYNLRTRQKVGNINVPNLIADGSVGSVYSNGDVCAVYYEKKDCIYVFYRKNGGVSDFHYMYYYKYFPSTDTYENKDKRMSTYNGRISYTAPCIYEDKLYIYYDYYAGSNTYFGCSILDLETDTSSHIGSGSVSYGVSSKSYSDGKYIYLISSTDIWRYDCIENKTTFLANCNYNTYGYPSLIYGKGDKIFIFYNGKTFYRIYNISTGEFTDVEVSESYTLTSDAIPYFFDEAEGILYFRGASSNVLAFQFENSPSEANLPTDTTVIIQGLGYKNAVLIENSSNLQIGVSDVFVVDSNGNLNDGIIAYIGNGEEWRLLKGKVRVTFSTGEETSYGSATYGEPIAEPTIPSKDGYEFVCWTLNGQEYDFSTPIYEPITLEAKWTEISPTFIDYIESTGTQYIDTQVKTGLNIKVEAEFACLGTSDDVNYSGAVYGGGLGWIATGSYSQGYLCSYFCDSSRNGATIPFDNNFHTYLCSNGLQKVDDTQTNITATSMPTTLNLFIFKGNIDFSTTFSIKQRVKYYKIYDNGTLVRDFKPCKDTHGVYCLYDAVSNRYFYNAGTGSFRGSDWQPTTLEYIESTGTQYIDTRINPNQNTTLEIDFEYVGNDGSNSSEWVPIMGSKTSLSQMFALWYGKTTRKLAINFGNIDSAEIQGSETSTRATLLLKDCSLYKNGTLIYSNTISNFTGTVPIILFGVYNQTEIQTRGIYERIYSCKIYDNGTLVRDFKPCKDTRGVYCLYDKVSETYFYNAGTGSFIAG